MKNCLFDEICCLLTGEKNNLLERFIFVGLLFLMPLCFAATVNAQSDFASFVNRSDFNAVSSNLSTIDFESVAPAKGGFGKYPVNEGLTVNANLKPVAAARQSGGNQNENQVETPTNRPLTFFKNQSQKTSAVQPEAVREPANNSSSPSRKNSVSANAAGNIAYVRGGKEIRLIAPDGTNDRRIWTNAGASQAIGINELAWRPDGKELAFSSGHDAIFSLYHADIYAIKPDGTGLRKLTNAPDRSELARFPKGSVSVTVRNDQPIYRQSNASAGIFIIYVAGADEPQQIALPPGAARTLVFKSVADFGSHAQPIVALMGGNRWFIPGIDVQAGRLTKAPNLSMICGCSSKTVGIRRGANKY